MMTKMKFFVALAMAASMATTAFAAPREVHSWEELQAICRVPLAQRDPQGNATNDGGRLGYLSWNVDGWRVTDDWKVFSESPDQKKTGDVIPAGSQFYAWFLGGNSTPSPTPAPAPTPAPVTPAPEAEGLVTYANLSKFGKVTQRDSLWMEYVPFQSCTLDLAVFACFDQDNFSNEVIGLEGQAAIGALRQGGHYLLAVRELFKSFVPEDEDDLALLCHPKFSPVKREFWAEQPPRQNWDVVLAADWLLAENCVARWDSDVDRKPGELAPAGRKIYVAILSSSKKGGSDGGNSGGGGGGCDAGMGLTSLAAVAIFLKRKTA